MTERRWGFTLIETAVTLTIFTGIMGLVVLFSLDIADFTVKFEQDLDAQQEVGLTLRIINTELRSIEAAENGAYPVVAASTSSFSFYSDIDSDGAVEQVRYFVSSSTIWKMTIKPTSTPAIYPTSSAVTVEVIHNVLDANFSYYDDTYTGSQDPLSDPVSISDIRVIRFYVNVDKFPGSTPGPFESSIIVTLRNLRTNI